MKKVALLFVMILPFIYNFIRMVSVCILIFGAFSCKTSIPTEMDRIIDSSMQIAINHAINMSETLKDSTMLLPRTFEKEKFKTSDSRWWCSGFYPGVLWYLYEYSKDPSIELLAQLFTSRIEREKYTTDNHDVGFMLYCSFGNGLRLTGNENYEEVLETGAKSLATRYNPKIGLIRSWDFNKDRWQYPVIIDNMMNLELLMWAYKQTGNEMFKTISVNHADKTMNFHYRKDNSCYHVVSYDTTTTLPHKRETWQGAADESAWSRGQAWGLYGFTYMYRETGLQRYLDKAIKIADYMIKHPNMPADFIPYWDYDAPNIPDEPRDASAGALMASALIELSVFVDSSLGKEYLKVAETQIKTLSSSEYLAEPGTNGNFILKHSTGAKPFNSEVDVPLTYADYYYVEAMLRYKNLKNKD